MPAVAAVITAPLASGNTHECSISYDCQPYFFSCSIPRIWPTTNTVHVCFYWRNCSAKLQFSWAGSVGNVSVIAIPLCTVQCPCSTWSYGTCTYDQVEQGHCAVQSGIAITDTLPTLPSHSWYQFRMCHRMAPCIVTVQSCSRCLTGIRIAEGDSITLVVGGEWTLYCKSKLSNILLGTLLQGNCVTTWL